MGLNSLCINIFKREREEGQLYKIQDRCPLTRS